MEYSAQSCTPKQLKKYFSRYALAVLLSIFCSNLLAGLLMELVPYLVPKAYLAGEGRFVVSLTVNDLAGYLPAILLVPLLLRKLPKSKPLPVDHLTFGELVQSFLFSMGLVETFSLFTTLLTHWLTQKTGLEFSNILNEVNNTYPGWLLMLNAAVIAPVCEELIFRKLLLDRLRVLGDTAAVLLSALAFALFHGNLFQTFYAFAAGAFFAAVVLLTGSIWDTILLHMLVNSFSFIVTENLSPVLILLLNLFSLCALACVPVLLWCHRHTFEMEPGPLPFRGREKVSACLRSVWFWVMLLAGIWSSVALPVSLAMQGR